MQDSNKDSIRLQADVKKKWMVAIVVSIGALIWLFIPEPTDVIPVAGWIDEGGFLFAAYKCILKAKEAAEITDKLLSETEYGMSAVAERAERFSNNVSNTSERLIQAGNTVKDSVNEVKNTVEVSKLNKF